LFSFVLFLHFNRRFFFWVDVFDIFDIFDIFLIFFETFAADA